jgi:pimeloyl-ACP methyl ester carboxylesterase
MPAALKKGVFIVLLAALMGGCASVHLNVPPVSQNRTIEESDANGVPTWAILPPSYNPQVANPWIIYDHGIGQSIASIAARPPQSNFVHSLTLAGFVVIASDYRNLACWGNQECVEDISNLQALWRSRLNLSPRPFVIGESMGGIVTWNAISHGALKPLAVVGIYPGCNLAVFYSKRVFRPTIQTAYGFVSPAGYAGATRGSDPILTPPSAFADFPIEIWASYSDRVVLRSKNEDPFAQAINAAGGSVTVHPSRGRHGDPSNFDADAVIAFFSSFRS